MRVYLRLLFEVQIDLSFSHFFTVNILAPFFFEKVNKYSNDFSS